MTLNCNDKVENNIYENAMIQFTCYSVMFSVHRVSQINTKAQKDVFVVPRDRVKIMVMLLQARVLVLLFNEDDQVISLFLTA